MAVLRCKANKSNATLRHRWSHRPPAIRSSSGKSENRLSSFQYELQREARLDVAARAADATHVERSSDCRAVLI